MYTIYISVNMKRLAVIVYVMHYVTYQIYVHYEAASLKQIRRENEFLVLNYKIAYQKLLLVCKPLGNLAHIKGKIK